MTYTLLAVSSITYAMKGKRLLNGMGYYCEIEKTPKGLSSGCGHSLRVRDDPEVICSLLRRNGIDTRDRMTVNR
ncbi:MAG: DUF3343 domain-containing protein [Oscillospiraceae bacterium]|nr:DUF3343 domain-containing protein [Oscillospiraceae bacterium]